MQYTFGSGNLWGIPLTDALGSAIAAPSPVKFGALQDVSVELSFDVKELHGQNQFPLAIGRGKGKITGKAKFAQIFGNAYNALFFGQTMTAGTQRADYIDSTGAAIPGTPYQITPVVPNSGTWAEDLGVRDSNGVGYTRVASAPATGQYSVSAGVYTFAAADTGKTVFIEYRYTYTSANAKTIAVVNQPLGYLPTFKAELFAPYNGKILTISLPSCVGTKLTFPTKLDDFMIPEFDFSGFADGSGNVMTLGFSE